MSRLRQATILARVIGIIATGAFPLLLLGALGASIQMATGLSDHRFGLVFASYSACSLSLALAGGGLAERLGWRRSAFLASALGTLCLAGLMGLGWHPLSIYVVVCFGGAAQAVSGPTANLLLTREWRSGRQATAMGLKQSAVPMASMTAGLLVPLIAVPFGWRVVCGVGAIGLAIVGLSVAGRRSPEGIPLRVTASNGATSGRQAQGSSLRLMAVGGFFGTAAALSFNGFFVLTAVRRGITEPQAAYVFAASSIGSIVVRVGSGILADRQHVERQAPLKGAAIILAAGSVGFGCLAWGEGPAWAIGALLAGAAGWGWPALYHYAIVKNFAGEPARATGRARVGLASGAMLGPLAFGTMTGGQLGDAGAWSATALAGLVGAAFLWRVEASI